jgi:hypothetical protein
MSDNVVSLRGAEPIITASTPVDSVVKELERLLELARSGELIGLAGVYKHRSRSVEYSYAGAVQGFALVGALECVKQRLAQRAVDRE